MTLATTPIYDEWKALLTSKYGVSESNATLLVDSITGDPRIAFTSPQSPQELEQLRNNLSTILSEFDLTEFGSMSSQSEVHDDFLTTFDDYLAQSDVGKPNTTADSSESQADSDSISVDVSDQDREFAVGAAAGAGAEAPGGDVAPREEGLTDEDVHADLGDSTEDSSEETPAEATSESKSESETEELPVAAMLPHLVLRGTQEELNEELDVPLEIVAPEMVEFGARVVDAYSDILASELFAGRPSHEQKVLFESLILDDVQSNLQQMMDEDDN